MTRNLKGTGKRARTATSRRSALGDAGEDAIRAVLRRPYSWIVSQDANGRFSARITELPGCATDGATRAEALKNLEDAAHDWVKGALEDGFPVPPPAERERASGKFLLRLPRTLHRKVQELAAAEAVSANTFLISAISAQVGAVEFGRTVLQQIRSDFRTAAVRASGAAATSPPNIAATIATLDISYDDKNSAVTPMYVQ